MVRTRRFKMGVSRNAPRGSKGDSSAPIEENVSGSSQRRGRGLSSRGGRQSGNDTERSSPSRSSRVRVRGRGRAGRGVGRGASSSTGTGNINDKGIIQRCRPLLLTNFFLGSVQPKMTQQQKDLLESTGFAHLFEMPDMFVCPLLFEKIVKSFDPKDRVFKIAGRTVDFTDRDVAVLLGELLNFFYL